MRTLTIQLAALLLTLPSSAANLCVGPAATGNGSGADWNNMMALPQSPVRGNTYWLSDGNYGTYRITGPVRSGSSYVTLRKATAAEHVTETGWSASFGDNLAEFYTIYPITAGGTLQGYWEFNGYDAALATNRYCGIRFNLNLVNNYGFTTQIGDTGSWPYLAFRYIDLRADRGTGDYSTWDGTSYVSIWGIYLYQNQAGLDASHATIAHCWFHNGITTPIGAVQGSSGLLVEWNLIEDSRCLDPPPNNDHGNMIWLGASDTTIRYNIFRNYNAEGIFMKYSAARVKIYGNLFYSWGFGSGRGIEYRDASDYPDNEIYNNTFVGFTNVYWLGYIENGYSLSGFQCKNNLIVDCGAGNVSNPVQENNLVRTYSAFVNAAGGDFRLANPIAGTSLATAYNTDLDGNTRGVDGTWDVGAYEYGGTPSSNALIHAGTSTPTPFVLSGTTSNYTVIVTNVGTADLTNGAASVAAPFYVSNAVFTCAVGATTNITIGFVPTSYGNYAATLTLTGGGGANVALTGAAYRHSELPILVTNNLFTALWTSNSNGTITHSADSDAPASSGLFLAKFTITNTGPYQVRSVVSAPSTSADSIWWNINAEPVAETNCWDMTIATGETTQTNDWRGNGTFSTPEWTNVVLQLDAGDYLLYIRGREANVGLRSVTFVSAEEDQPVPMPFWLSQPSSLTVSNGTRVEFICYAANATGYLWYHAGTNINENGANVSIYGANALVRLAQSTNAGDWFVVATNVTGSITSRIATLTVTNTSVAPTITADLPDTAIRFRRALTLGITATGTGPFTYIWRCTNSAGLWQQFTTTDPTLTLEDTSSEDIGNWWVTVMNSAGVANSRAAVVRWKVVIEANQVRVGN